MPTALVTGADGFIGSRLVELLVKKGYKIKAVHVESDAVSVDTLDDLIYVRNKMHDDYYFKQYKSP